MSTALLWRPEAASAREARERQKAGAELALGSPDGRGLPLRRKTLSIYDIAEEEQGQGGVGVEEENVSLEELAAIELAMQQVALFLRMLKP